MGKQKTIHRLWMVFYHARGGGLFAFGGLFEIVGVLEVIMDLAAGAIADAADDGGRVDALALIIIGKGGEKLKQIGSRARQDIERFLDAKVYLELWVKVKEDWRNKESFMNTIGFE